jgi:hypothetical protein
MIAGDVFDPMWQAIKQSFFLAAAVLAAGLMSASAQEYRQEDLLELLDELKEDYLGKKRQIAASMAGPGEASRIFAGPHQFPPEEFAAWGMVIFKSKATDFDIDRYKIICAAYVSALPHYLELDLPLDQQIATVWPVDSDAVADAINNDPARDPCKQAVAHYGLRAAMDARSDAALAGVGLSGRGPFLVAWSPAGSKGGAEAVVLRADLSHVETIQQAKSVFEKWVSDIEENQDVWQDGWDIEQLRISIRNWLDYYGRDILELFG